MHDHRPILVHRVERTLRERIRPAETTVLRPLDVAEHLSPATHTDAHQTWSEARSAQYVETSAGRPWGAPWTTTWLRMTADVPAEAAGRHLELVVDLGWFDHSAGFQPEGLVRSADGTVLKAINPRNQWIPVEAGAASVEVYVEAAANPLLLDVLPFQPTPLGDPATADPTAAFVLRRADLVEVHDDVRALVADMSVLYELATTLPESDARGWECLLGLGRAIDALNLADVPATAAAAREVLAPLLAVPARPDAHAIVAVGHAHIDSAWLWPIRETRRKVARTLANVLRLVEDGSPMIFALPAAQHVAWLQADQPELYDRLVAAVHAGSVVPVGGMWVEPDAVLPGGEALARQFTEGMSFFEKSFGHTCTEIWLPDSFGYSAAIPQLARLVGIRRFLTQKLSWNQVDTFPHHTLWWEGLDGSRVFTHFPPVDTYGAEVTGANVQHAAANFKDKGHASVSLMPYGYGDGGGGPTREMLERIDRFADLAGAPRIAHGSPAEFFAQAEADYPDAPVWVGELYLELHRGTFTSQIAAKQGNRAAEARLRAAELWATVATVRTGAAYPHEELREAWRTVLLCQFHDILPGTSIAWVYQEVAERYAHVEATCAAVVRRAAAQLAEHAGAGVRVARVALNSSPFPVRRGGTTIPALGAAPLAATDAHVTVDRDGEVTILDNGVLRVRLDGSARVVSLVDLATGRDAVPPGSSMGELHLHQDFPNMWDAWDIDPFYRDSQQTLAPEVGAEISYGEDGSVTVRGRVAFGASTAEIAWTLPPHEARLDVAVDLDWHEKEKLLKLAFPVDVHTDHAAYETQFGHVTRPTHVNTSWDAYRFEVPCHRWLRVAEPAWGIGITNRATYGWDVTRHERDGGGTYSLVRASLARAARFPDPEQDQGRHHYAFAVLPGADTAATVADAYRATSDLIEVEAPAMPSFVEVTGAVVESVHFADDGSGDVLVRAYDAFGTRTRATVVATWARDCRGVDLRGADGGLGVEVRPDGGGWAFDVRPFQVVTLRLTPRKDATCVSE